MSAPRRGDVAPRNRPPGPGCPVTARGGTSPPPGVDARLPTSRPGRSPPSRCGWSRRPGPATCRARTARRRTPRSDSSADTADIPLVASGTLLPTCSHGADALVAPTRAEGPAPSRARRSRLDGELRSAPLERWRRGTAVAFRAAGIALSCSALLAFLGPWRGTVFAGARKVLGGDRYSVIDDKWRSTAFPTSSILPAEFPQQGPENVLDTYANTAWATRWLSAGEPGRGRAVRRHMPRSDERRCRVEVHVRRADRRGPHPHPRRSVRGRPGARAVLPPAGRRTARSTDACDYIELDDTGELSIHDFRHRDVDEVDLRIVDVFADPESSNTVEISEVVFDRRRDGDLTCRVQPLGVEQLEVTQSLRRRRTHPPRRKWWGTAHEDDGAGRRELDTGAIEDVDISVSSVSHAKRRDRSSRSAIETFDCKALEHHDPRPL